MLSITIAALIKSLVRSVLLIYKSLICIIKNPEVTVYNFILKVTVKITSSSLPTSTCFLIKSTQGT